MLGYKAAVFSLKLAFGLQLISFWIQIIAYATPYWASRKLEYAGLWKGCNKFKTEWTCYERYNLWVESWLHIVQIFMTITITLHFAAALCIAGYLFHVQFYIDKRLIFWACCANVLGTIFNFISIILFPAKQSFKNGEILNFSYYFSCLAFILALPVSICLVKELKNEQPPLNSSQVYNLQAPLLFSPGNPNPDSSTSTNPSFFRNYRENYLGKSSPLFDS